MKKLLSVVALFVILSCSKSDSSDNNVLIGIKTPFTEGKIEFGIYSQEIELGGIIDEIDFTADNVAEQVQNYMSNTETNKNVFNLIEQISQQNPLLAFSMMLNIHQSTVFIKNEEAMAKIKGFGWIMEHYHNPQKDSAKIYLETFATTSEIEEEDKKLYATYVPSLNQVGGNGSAIDLNTFTHKSETQKELVAGYVCDISTYTSNNHTENSIYKIVAFSSPLIHKTINFTHPYYIPEEGGILRLDVYLQNSNTPTFSMVPKKVESSVVSSSDLTIQTTNNAYDVNDIEWGLKSFQIMMSGWSLLEN